MDGHALVRRPRSFRGKIRDVVARGCTCGLVTVVASDRAGIVWHAEHVRSLGAATPVVEPTPSLAEMQARLDGLRTDTDALIGG